MEGGDRHSEGTPDWERKTEARVPLGPSGPDTRGPSLTRGLDRINPAPSDVHSLLPLRRPRPVVGDVSTLEHNPRGAEWTQRVQDGSVRPLTTTNLLPHPGSTELAVTNTGKRRRVDLRNRSSQTLTSGTGFRKQEKGPVFLEQLDDKSHQVFYVCRQQGLVLVRRLSGSWDRKPPESWGRKPPESTDRVNKNHRTGAPYLLSPSNNSVGRSRPVEPGSHEEDPVTLLAWVEVRVP